MIEKSSKENNPNVNLELLLKDSNLQRILTDYAEIIIDSFLDDSFLKEIPIVGTIMDGIKFVNSINKNITAKKLMKILFQLKDVPVEDRQKMINKINESEKYQSTVGEMLWEIIDKVDNEGKPEVIGRLFRAFILEKISYESFLKASYTVNSIFYFDLLKLKANYDGNKIIGNIPETFFTYGLTSYPDFASQLEIQVELGDKSKSKEEKQNQLEEAKWIKLTEMGEIILRYGLAL